MRCQLQELILSKFNLNGREQGKLKEYFLEELRELVLPADFLLDPANGLVETPHDDRYRIFQVMKRFAVTVSEVGSLSYTSLPDHSLNGNSLTTT